MEGNAGQKGTSAVQVNTSSGIFNPKKLTPEQSVDFCGACHGSYWDINLNSVSDGVSKVRFEPYRLEQSKCWNKNDGRLTCIACHDPHKPLDKNASDYDHVCLSCHFTTATADSPTRSLHAKTICLVAKENCTTCHMPKVYVPAAYRSFPDHRIRIAKEGEAFPD